MAMSAPSDNRGEWGSKFGFIMAAAGSAVGLGNIWRFPYITGQNGGGAFVLIYLACVILIGVPLLFTEMGFGRMTKKSTIGAFNDTKANPIIYGIRRYFGYFGQLFCIVLLRCNCWMDNRLYRKILIRKHRDHSLNFLQIQ